MSENVDVLKFNERLSDLENIRFESGDWTEGSLGFAKDKARRKFYNIPDHKSDEFKKRRRLTETVTFKPPFKETPKVFKGLSYMDIGDSNDNVRVELKVADLTPGGFTLIIETWMGTRFYGFRIEWLAHTMGKEKKK